MNEVAARPPRKLQFTIAQALLATAFIGVFVGVLIGYAVNDVFSVAGVFGVLVSLIYIQLLRTTRRWKTLALWQRAYGCIGAGGLLAALVAFVAIVVWGVPSVQGLKARHLRHVLSEDSRFLSVQVKYVEGKTREFLSVDGQVDSDRDFQALREIVKGYDWHNNRIEWAVHVRSPNCVYEGSDRVLFRDG